MGVERVCTPSRLPLCQAGGCWGADPPGFLFKTSSMTDEYVRRQCFVSLLLPPLKMAFSELSPPA